MWVDAEKNLIQEKLKRQGMGNVSALGNLGKR